MVRNGVRLLQLVVLVISLSYATPYFVALSRTAGAGWRPVEQQLVRQAVEAALWWEEVPGQAGQGEAFIAWLLALRDPQDAAIIRRFLELRSSVR